MTVNCHPNPTLQVYGKSINHVTDFRYFDSKIASAASDFKRRKILAWSTFWKLECLWGPSQLSISMKMNLFYTTHLPLWLWILGDISWHGKKNQRLSNFLLWDYAHTINDNDMLSYSLTTMMCFWTKEWYGFPAYTVNLFIKAYHRITYKED